MSRVNNGRDQLMRPTPIIDPNQRRGNSMPYGVVAPPNDATQEFKTVSNVIFLKVLR
jgi:hypothetical protein